MDELDLVLLSTFLSMHMPGSTVPLNASADRDVGRNTGPALQADARASPAVDARFRTFHEEFKGMATTT
jgi:hypothetical protein